MMRRSFTTLVLLSGCAHTAAPGAVAVSPQGGGSPPPADAPAEPGGPPYAGLFEEGRAFHFITESRSTWWDDQDPAADADGNVVSQASGTMTCRVTEVQRIGQATAASILCEGEAEGPVSLGDFGGVYVATNAGLWHEGTLPADPAAVDDLNPASMLLPAVPVARRERHEDEEEEGFGWAVEVKQEPDGRWCVVRESWGGDESGITLCFAAGQGLVGGGIYFAGGVIFELTFHPPP